MVKGKDTSTDPGRQEFKATYAYKFHDALGSVTKVTADNLISVLISAV